jgi:coenzyme Q-binding protein COQ10
MLFRALLPAVTKSHTERRIFQTDPHHLLRIITDVDQYSQFLPFCSHSKILSSSSRSSNSFQATLTVGFSPLFQETYVSQVNVDPQRFLVSAKSIESKLFDSLSSIWKLQPLISNEGDSDLQQQCQVDFQVQLTVRDPLIVGMLDQVLQQVASRQVQAFEQRCRQLPIMDDVRQ